MIVSYEDALLWGKVVVATGSVLSALGVLYKYVIIPLYDKYIKLKEKIKNDYNQWRSLANTAVLVHDIITKELQTNGGSSIKDALKRIENKLTFIEAKNKAYLSLEDEPIWESDEFGHCIWANHSYLKITGFEFNYLKNAGWISIINEEDRSRVREEWNRAVEEKRVFYCEYIINRYDGTKLKVLGIGHPVLSIVDDSVKGYIGRLTFCESAKF